LAEEPGDGVLDPVARLDEAGADEEAPPGERLATEVETDEPLEEAPEEPLEEPPQEEPPAEELEAPAEVAAEATKVETDEPLEEAPEEPLEEPPQVEPPAEELEAPAEVAAGMAAVELSKWRLAAVATSPSAAARRRRSTESGGAGPSSARRASRGSAGWSAHNTNAKMKGLAFTRYSFTPKPSFTSQSSLYCPLHLLCSHYCSTIARLLRNIRPPPDPPCICHTSYRIGSGNKGRGRGVRCRMQRRTWFLGGVG